MHQNNVIREPKETELDFLANLFLYTRKSSSIALIVIIIAAILINGMFIFVLIIEKKAKLFVIILLLVINIIFFFAAKLFSFYGKSKELLVSNVMSLEGKLERFDTIRSGPRIYINGFLLTIPLIFTKLLNMDKEYVKCLILPYAITVDGKKGAWEYLVVEFENVTLDENIKNGKIKLKYLEKEKKDL